ncbi:MAG TPA: nucleotidyltransferase family protein [Abditibacterium sp.]|jgi:molybdenum cofactor cytidylyltransferase
MNSQTSVGIVILAAGASARLGRPKQLLKIEGQTLLRRTVQTALNSSAKFVVVTLAAGDVASEMALAGLEFHLARVENAQFGQSESVRAGLELAAPDCEAILFAPCDLPLLSTSHLDALISRFEVENRAIVASRYDETLGAPLVLGRELWPEVRQLRGDVGARKIVAEYAAEAAFIEWNGGRFDLDTPEDYAAWLSSSEIPHP